MSQNFVQNGTLRSTLMNGYRLYARAQFWRKGPRVLINSIPKAGTHLLTSELDRFNELRNSRLHLEITKLLKHGQRGAETLPTLDLRKVERSVRTIRAGQYFSAHLYWNTALAELMANHGVKIIFMSRDPRDILMSRLHYIKGLKRHWLHNFITNHLSDDIARLRALILGHADEPMILSQRTTLDGFAKWAQSPLVLAVKFEDLVGERGGGSAQAKLDTLYRIASHVGLRTDRLEELAHSATGPTPTLRKGKIGSWRTEMPEEIVALYSQRCGDLVSSLGYSPE